VSSFLLIVFYQNYSSFKGGIFTLLTNRVGDAILLMVLAYCLYLCSESSFFVILRRVIISGGLFLSSLTKSAQLPFVN